MDKKTYSILNGKLVLAARAAIPITDRGFRFGDGVFETIRIETGIPYQWDLHMRRLFEGLTAIRIASPVEDWVPYAKKLLKKNEVERGFLRIAVSRGMGSRGYAPYPPGMPPTWLIETLPAATLPEQPCRLWLSVHARVPRQCLPVHLKLAQGLGSTLALLEAADHHCDEALQLTPDGFLCEAASANLFWISDEALFTPSLETGCLNGTTRDALMRLTPVGIKVVKTGIAALEDAQAVFLTNCRYGVWPVAELKPLGKRYDTSHRLLRQFAALLEKDRINEATVYRKDWNGKR